MSTMSDRVAVVTGAGRGIGLAIVRVLADRGARVVAAARTVTPEMRDAASRAHTVDLAKPDGPDELIRLALEEFEGIDVLVNNVGAFEARIGGFEGITDADW